MPSYEIWQSENEASMAAKQFADSQDVLAAMDSYYGTNLKDEINIHDDDASHEMADKEGVDVVSAGNDIYFGEGAYDMDDKESRELLADEAINVIEERGFPIPSMSPTDGPDEQSGPVTFQNADLSLGDGWEEMPEDTEKRDESFEEVLLHSAIFDNSVTEMLRRLKIATENGNTLNADDMTQYEEALLTVNQLEDATEDTRTAKAWAMRFLRSINPKMY